MEKLILFGILSVLIVLFSWRTLFNIKSHGFYRFFSWECIAWLFANNVRVWFVDPFHLNQLFSWIFLLLSIYLVIAGVMQMRRKGKPQNNRTDKSLYAFEKTSELVDSGIFRYLRHPLYSSLLFLTWGILLKNPTVPLSAIAVLSSLFLFLTALYDEKECQAYFGESYREYMKRSKRFIPFVL